MTDETDRNNTGRVGRDWTTEEALKWADTFGPIQSDPPNGDGPALEALAKEVRKLRAEIEDAEATIALLCEDCGGYKVAALQTRLSRVEMVLARWDAERRWDRDRPMQESPERRELREALADEKEARHDRIPEACSADGEGSVPSRGAR